MLGPSLDVSPKGKEHMRPVFPSLLMVSANPPPMASPCRASSRPRWQLLVRFITTKVTFSLPRCSRHKSRLDLRPVDQRNFSDNFLIDWIENLCHIISQ